MVVVVVVVVSWWVCGCVWSSEKGERGGAEQVNCFRSIFTDQG